LTLRLNGSTSGYTEIDAPAVAGSNTLVLPTGNGSSGQYLQTNGSGTLSWAGVTGLPAQALTAATSVSASGTSIDFTGIPSTVKRITVMYSQISTNGNATPRVQLGTSSGVTTSGYIGSVQGSSTSNLAAGFDNSSGYASAANVFSGLFIITLLGNDTWVTNGITGGSSTGAYMGYCSGMIALGGTLDRVRFTTSNGTDAFDAGNVNILYEG
jgi:hypothetical protein